MSIKFSPWKMTMRTPMITVDSMRLRNPEKDLPKIPVGYNHRDGLPRIEPVINHPLGGVPVKVTRQQQRLLQPSGLPPRAAKRHSKFSVPRSRTLSNKRHHRDHVPKVVLPVELGVTVNGEDPQGPAPTDRSVPPNKAPTPHRNPNDENPKWKKLSNCKPKTLFIRKNSNASNETSDI